MIEAGRRLLCLGRSYAGRLPDLVRQLDFACARLFRNHRGSSSEALDRVHALAEDSAACGFQEVASCAQAVASAILDSGPAPLPHDRRPEFAALIGQLRDTVDAVA